MNQASKLIESPDGVVGTSDLVGEKHKWQPGLKVGIEGGGVQSYGTEPLICGIRHSLDVRIELIACFA